MTTPAKKPFDAEMPERIYIPPDLTDQRWVYGEVDYHIKYIREDRYEDAISQYFKLKEQSVPRQDVDALIEAVRKVIEDGVQETEGQYNSHKNNKCRHGQFGYEGCDQCTCEFLEQALSEFQSKYGSK